MTPPGRAGAPRRTCIGCRRVRERAELVRLVRRADGTVSADPTGAAAGRGAWICADGACVDKAVKMRRFGPAFRKPSVAGADLTEEVRGLWRQR